MIAAFDINTVANAVYQHNFGLKPTSVNLEHLSVEHFDKMRADCWLLSPPCQPYTRGGKMLDDQDNRALGLLHMIKVLEGMVTPPKYIFLENVLNFEISRSRERLVAVLAKRGYEVREFLISPNDPWVNIPNDRLRYYLAAERVSPDADGERPLKDNYIIKSLSEILGFPPKENSNLPPIGQYLSPEEGADPQFLVPMKYIADYKEYRHDIANPLKSRSTTFTKAYGSNYIIGTGSFLQTQRLEMEYEPDDVPTLLTLGLRFFTPTEIARLHALPIDSDHGMKYGFAFPANVTLIQQYRLLGNSLNVRVVSRILSHLLKTSKPSSENHIK